MENPENFELYEGSMKEISDSHSSRASSIDLPFQTDELLPVDHASIVDSKSERTLSPLQLVFLTIGNGGLQVVWTAIMSQGSPYLFLLGVPTYLVSLIWLAGPLSGSLVQPYVGVLSDRCQHAWGRRKPFIVFGTVGTILSILALPRTEISVEFVLTNLGGSADGRTARVMKGLVAAAWIWILNVTIQPVQVGIRALIVDCCPPRQQASAQAYASCAAGVGSILGYTSGFIPLKTLGPYLGNSQFKVISVITSWTLGLTVVITCLGVKEAEQVIDEDLSIKKTGFAIVRHAFNSIQTIPAKVRKVCIVQFFAWIGWFFFLFYVTTYLGDLYRDELRYASNSVPAQSSRQVRHDSIRYGNMVMTGFASVALLSNILFPFFVAPASRLTGYEESKHVAGEKTYHRSMFLSKLYFKPTLPVSWLTIPRLWTASLLLYSVIVMSTSFTQACLPSSVLIALLGTSWAVNQWAPLVLISKEIAKQGASRKSHCSPTDSRLQESHRMESSSNDFDGEEERDRVGVQSRAGTILGVYNISVATPQIIAAIGSGALFWIMGFWGLVDKDAIGWVIRMGSVTAGIATLLAAGIETD